MFLLQHLSIHYHLTYSLHFFGLTYPSITPITNTAPATKPATPSKLNPPPFISSSSLLLIFFICHSPLITLTK